MQCRSRALGRSMIPQRPDELEKAARTRPACAFRPGCSMPLMRLLQAGCRCVRSRRRRPGIDRRRGEPLVASSLRQSEVLMPPPRARAAFLPPARVGCRAASISNAARRTYAIASAASKALQRSAGCIRKAKKEIASCFWRRPPAIMRHSAASWRSINREYSASVWASSTTSRKPKTLPRACSFRSTTTPAGFAGTRQFPPGYSALPPTDR